MGQEQSALAQQSINNSAERPRMTAIDDMQPPAGQGNAQDQGASAWERKHGRTPMHGRLSVSSPTRSRYPQSPPSYRQPQSPLDPRHGTGRFPSPGSVRHKFVRERHEGRQSLDHRHPRSDASPGSPDDRARTREDACHQRSPPSRRVSENFSKHFYASGSPDMHHIRASDNFDHFGPSRTRSVGQKIDFEGLKGVPVGPSSDTGVVGASQPQRAISLPFIFIPSLCMYMRNIETARKHLYRLLKDVAPLDMIIDAYGWHLIYGDSLFERDKLERCFAKFNGNLFFGQYRLSMQCFPDGNETVDQQGQSIRSGARLDTKGPRAAQLQRHVDASPECPRFEGRKITYPDPIRENDSTRFHASSLHAQANAQLNEAVDGPLQDDPRSISTEQGAHSLRPDAVNRPNPALRSGGDDSASVASGTTDTSRRKWNKCHVCRGESSPGFPPLVGCSTCLRVFHRRCHQDPPIPQSLPVGGSWRCRSCVKKGRAHAETLLGDMIQSSSALASSYTGPSPSIEGLGSSSEMSQRRAGETVLHNAGAFTAPEARPYIVRSDPTYQKALQLHPTAEMGTTLASSALEDNMSISDPDDLVQKSFAAERNKSPSKPSLPKPSKPMILKRTKIAPSTKSVTPRRHESEITPAQSVAKEVRAHPQNSSKITSSAQNQLSESEESPAQSAPKSKHTHPQTAPKQASVPAGPNEAVARNSAADLRALAHDRHQSVMKSGVKSQTASEARKALPPPLDNAKNTPSAPRSANDTANHRPLAKPAPQPTAPRLEIPESPDEVRHSVPLEDMTPDQAIPAKDSHVNARVQHVLKADRVTSANQIGRQIVSKGPRGPSAATCERCERKIPQGPSGKNKLCTSCKRVVAAEGDANSKINAKSQDQEPRLQKHAVVLSAGTGAATSPDGAQRPPAGTGGDRSKNIDRPSLDVQPSRSADAPTGEASINNRTQATGEPSGEAANGTVEQHRDVAMESTRVLNRRERPGVVPGPRFGKTTYPDRSQTTDAIVEPPAGGEHEAHLDSELDEDAPATTAADTVNVTTSSSYLTKLRTLVGDSFKRPKGLRLQLVGMALCSTPTRRMQQKDVMGWIASNIPTYEWGKGDWQSSVSSMLCQSGSRDGAQKKDYTVYWRQYDWQQGDDGDPKYRWYQLLEDKEDMIWKWCPVRKEPLIPPPRSGASTTVTGKRRRAIASTGATTSFEAPSTNSVANSSTTILTRLNSERRGSNLSGSKSSGASGEKAKAQDEMDVDEAQAEITAQGRRQKEKEPRASLLATTQRLPGINGSSSDDEPLAKRRRGNQEKTLHPATDCQGIEHLQMPANTEIEELPGVERDAGIAATRRSRPDSEDSDEAASLMKPGRKGSKIVKLRVRGTRQTQSHSAPLKARKSQQDLALSLYKEWPEHRENAFDEEDKLAEICKRPSKKQRFGKHAAQSRLGPIVPLFDTLMSSTNASPAKRARKPVDHALQDPFPWENQDADPTRQEYKTLEEFFDFPDNMISIASDGQLAYRDGTRTDDGRLSRTRGIFKPAC